MIRANKCEFALESVTHPPFRRRFRGFCRTAIYHARPLSRLRPSQQCRAHKKSKLDRSAQSNPPSPCCRFSFHFCPHSVPKCRSMSRTNQAPSRRSANAGSAIMSREVLSFYPQQRPQSNRTRSKHILPFSGTNTIGISLICGIDGARCCSAPAQPASASPNTQRDDDPHRAVVIGSIGSRRQRFIHFADIVLQCDRLTKTDTSDLEVRNRGTATGWD